MAKKVIAVVKLQITAGKATPAPPVGPALGQHGINIMDFCNAFNEQTMDKGDVVLPTVITIYEDKSFDFVIKTPPTAELIKKELKLEKGSSEPNKKKIGKITREQIRKIAEKKMQDLNTHSIEKAMKMVEGTAKNMGLEIV
uniref:Large ribosomal subunit protein uL11 n=1 Tax=candidate division CPR3 bacterium TaxID=2268181 RepID=A0A7C5UT02_UNCC3